MDLYETHKSNPDIFQKLSMKDILFLFYGCPQLKTTLSLYAKHTMFNFTLCGKRLFHHGDHTWISNSEKGLLVKRCAFLQELPPKYEDWNVIAFYLKDDYLRSIFDDFRPHLSLKDLPELKEA